MNEKYEQFATMEFSDGTKIDCFITESFKFFYGNSKFTSNMFMSYFDLQYHLWDNFGKYNLDPCSSSSIKDNYIKYLSEKVENERFVTME